VRFREPVLAALLLGASLYPGSRIAGVSESLDIGTDAVPRTLNEWLAKGFSVRKASADQAFMDILQYCGDRAFYLDHGEKLVRMAGNATDLDPRFTYVYLFSGAMLMWQCNRTRDAVELLKKGIRNNPADKRLKLYLAAFTYYRLKDLGSQVRALEELTSLPDPPPMLYRILANVYLKQGKLGEAAKLWFVIAEHSDDWVDREWAKGKLAKYGLRRVR